MILRKGSTLFVLGCIMCILCSCDPINRHKVLSTIFDGVPTLPPPEQICSEYAELKLAAFRDELAGKKAEGQEGSKTEKSIHPPYEEKKCDSCHDKTTESGLVRPLNQLCFVCHTDFLKGAYHHGPAAVADCLNCHVPHDSQNPSLLKVSKADVCATCHKEKRQAQGLHNMAVDRKIGCTDCHNPHYGNSPFFLK